MYDRLSQKQKDWIKRQTGAGIFVQSKQLWEKLKIDNETMKQMNAFWLNFKGITGKWFKYELEQENNLEELVKEVFK